MDVVLKVGDLSWNLGPRSILDSFFDTVACRLEPNGRATRFPLFSDDLKLGWLTAAKARAAIREMDTITEELRAIPTAKILWTGRQPEPNGAANALERLTAPDGRPLMQHLRYGVEQSLATGKTLSWGVPGQVQRERWSMVCSLLAGVVWMLFGYLMIPNWLLSPLVWSGPRITGIPIWSIGFLIAGAALFGLIYQAIPALKMWLDRHVWVSLILFLALIGIWIALFDVS